jgi:tRNA-dihydrouridine synthase
MGSALLSDLPRACSIVSTLRKNLNIPVTCKIRLLSDMKTTCDFVGALVKAGANAIAIHGREVGDQSQERAKWDRLCDVVKILTSSANTNVPIIINGDLYTRNDIVNLRRRSGAHGVMLARPALYNTSIFMKPNYAKLEPLDDGVDETRFGYDSPLLIPKTKVIQDYLEEAKLFQANTKNVKYVICEMMNNRRTPTQLAHFMPQSYTNGQAISQVCRCHTMADLCKIWDVSHSSVSTVVQDSDQVHVYDDRYFTDPEALHKERQAKLENEVQNETISNKKARIDHKT